MSIPFADCLLNPVGLPTGLFVDKLSGIGGIPKGYMTEIWGRNGTGKSTLCLQMVANFQKQGLRCLWIDPEFSYTPLYASKLGVDSSKLGLFRDLIAENSLDLIEDEIDAKNWDVIVLDSIGSLLTRTEAEKRSGEQTMATQGRLLAPWSRKVAPKLAMTGTALIVINHARQDFMSGAWIPTCGEKVQFHKGFSIYLRYAGATIKQGDKQIGQVIVAQVKKSKVSETYGMKVDAHFIKGKGFSASADILNDAIDAGVITKKGNTLYFGEEKLGIGLQKVRKLIEEDAELSERIKLALNENQGTEDTR